MTIINFLKHFIVINIGRAFKGNKVFFNFYYERNRLKNNFLKGFGGS